jgi:hypothetical protein
MNDRPIHRAAASPGRLGTAGRMAMLPAMLPAMLLAGPEATT